MVTQESTLTGLLNLIADLRAKEKELDAELEEVRRNIEAVQRASVLLRAKYGLPAESPKDESVYEALRGKTLIAALIDLAGSNNGVVKVTEAKRLLLEAGLLGNPRTAYQGITATLLRSNRFERVMPGAYRLVSQRAFQ